MPETNDEKPRKDKLGVEAIIFDDSLSPPLFLILHRSLNWKGWEFPKGGIDRGESREEALKREISEEAGLAEVEIVRQLPGLKEWASPGYYHYFDVFLVRADSKKQVSLPSEAPMEHDAFSWCQAKEVLEKLTHENSRDFFRIALKELGIEEANKGAEGARKEKRIHAIVSGMVQGVCFRANTQSKARSLSLKGFVRNTSGDRVEVVAEGPEQVLKELIGFLRKGPPGSRVENLALDWSDAQNGFKDFSIRY